MSVPLKVYRGTGPSALQKAVSDNHIIILVDVLRASSTIITALANGASAVIPAPTVSEARRIAAAHPNALDGSICSSIVGIVNEIVQAR